MNLGRTGAVFHKEFLHLIRDKRSLILAFFIPVMLMLILGVAINFDVDHIKLAVYDQCGDSESRKVSDSFVNSGYFDFKKKIMEPKQIFPLLDRGEVSVVLVIPQDYSKKVKRGIPSSVQILLDASDNSTAGIAAGYTFSILRNLSSENIEFYLNHQGKKGLVQNNPVEDRIRVYYNPTLKTKYSVVPALIAFVLALMSAFLVSMTISREWEQGTVEQIIVSPIKRHEFILGKFSFFFFLNFMQCGLLMLVAVTYFGVPYQGSLLLFALDTCLFLTAAVGLGLLFSIISRSMVLAFQLSVITSLLPSIILSGFIYPVESMPKPLMLITQIFPATHYIKSLRNLFLKDALFTDISREIAVLGLIGMILIILCIKSFKKRMA